LCPFLSFERLIVRADLEALFGSANGQRLCFLHAQERFHLTTLMRGYGWRCFAMGADGRLREESPRHRRTGIKDFSSSLQPGA
jgi:hypothetical protein